MSDQHIRILTAQARHTNSEINRRLAELEAEARHASERYRLYRAKVYGPRLTSFGRLRELERESKLAGGRLQRAKAQPGCASSSKGPAAVNVQAV